MDPADEQRRERIMHGILGPDNLLIQHDYLGAAALLLFNLLIGLYVKSLIEVRRGRCTFTAALAVRVVAAGHRSRASGRGPTCHARPIGVQPARALRRSAAG